MPAVRSIRPWPCGQSEERLQKWSSRNTSRIQVCWLKTQPQQQQQQPQQQQQQQPQQPEQPQQQRRQNLPASISLCNPLTQLTQHKYDAHDDDLVKLQLRCQETGHYSVDVKEVTYEWLFQPHPINQKPQKGCSLPMSTPPHPSIAPKPLDQRTTQEASKAPENHEVARSLSNGYWLRFKGCWFWEAFPKSVLQAFEGFLIVSYLFNRYFCRTLKHSQHDYPKFCQWVLDPLGQRFSQTQSAYLWPWRHGPGDTSQVGTCACLEGIKDWFSSSGRFSMSSGMLIRAQMQQQDTKPIPMGKRKINSQFIERQHSIGLSTPMK